ncbi:putative glutathione-specific gamma-glutamylcyclotransferase 2 [Lycorma delicatula]|uniref:putative glutathione-specific gamma-glutamylcyclotransferase 2 n=1 Tax=Lycorma delicatula TaxID=130591 RepID=UPI003F50D954
MWIFGYGSLIWKADFPYKLKLNGYIKGFVRRFYQHSIDHRGTPHKPGRVVTLLPSCDTEAKVWGVAYEIGEEDTESVIKHLDFREKNGYEKVAVKFYPANNNGVENVEPFDLCIYLGTADNQYYAGESDIDSIARIIVDSHGPSGSNKEYLYNLASAMRDLAPNENDNHLFELEAAVRILDNERAIC